MEINLFLCAIIILCCILANKFSYKFGVPSLVLFMIISSTSSLENNIYHIVLLVAFISVLIQGSLLSVVASKLNMVDEKFDIRKTFNDYQEESDMTLMRIFIPKGHHWQNKTLQEIHLLKRT